MDEQANVRKHTAARSKMNAAKPLIALAVVAAVAGLGFFGGVQYQKSKTTSTTAMGQSQNGTFGMGGMGQRQGRMGEFGTVTAVSSGSISIKNQRTSQTATYAITSSTTITNNGSTAVASDIAVGDTVLIEVSSSDSSTASRVVINPSMNGGPQMDSSGTTTQTN